MFKNMAMFGDIVFLFIECAFVYHKLFPIYIFIVLGNLTLPNDESSIFGTTNVLHLL